MLNLIASIYKKTVVYAGEAGIVMFTLAVAIYILLVNVRPNEFLDAVHKRAFWMINAFGIILAVTGTLLLNKDKLSITTNLAVSSLHGVISILFLAELFVIVQKGFAASKKKRVEKILERSNAEFSANGEEKAEICEVQAEIADKPAESGDKPTESDKQKQ